MKRTIVLAATLFGCRPAVASPSHHAAQAAPAPAIRAPVLPADVTAWQWTSLADGVYAAIAPAGVTPLVSGNSLVVVGDDGVLVVDTTQYPSTARWLVDHIEQVTDKPVKYVVTTHWHPDHWAGNGELLRVWPDAVLIATPNTRAFALTKAQPFMSAARVTTTIDAVDKVLASGKSSRGPLTPFERAYATMGVAQLRGYAQELTGATLAPPALTFDRDLTIHLGAREVDVRFLGRGNTGGDAVVYVPDAKVVATGDLVVAPYPYAIGSFIGEWIDTLGALEKIDAAVIVPGHGPLMHDHAYIDTEVALLRALQTQVGAAVAAKKSLADARKAFDVSEIRAKLCSGDPWCDYGFDHVFVEPGVARAYREATDGPLQDED
jgi:glyoxylase-like metal-dependent hydrolase (beta-lactamase superfamily II)